MRKDIKKAAESIQLALDLMEKVKNQESTPSQVRTKLEKITEALIIDKSELDRIREQHY